MSTLLFQAFFQDQPFHSSQESSKNLEITTDEGRKGH